MTKTGEANTSAAYTCRREPDGGPDVRVEAADRGEQGKGTRLRQNVQAGRAAERRAFSNTPVASWIKDTEGV